MGNISEKVVLNRNFDIGLVSKLAALSLAVFVNSSFGQALEEVLVTAEKRAASIQDVPISVSCVC